MNMKCGTRTGMFIKSSIDIRSAYGTLECKLRSRATLASNSVT